MPKRLAILRHAKSDWGQPGVADFDRPLNARGRAAADVIRREIAERALSFDLVLASPSVRTRETLDRLGIAATTVRWEDELYLADLAFLLEFVRALPDEARSALILGHNPGLHELVLELSGPDSNGLRKRVIAKFPTAALALLELDCASWSEVEPDCGEIVELLLPRELG